MTPVTACAPGRVNLIGGHVDFHLGPVVSMAIQLGVTAGASPRRDGRIVVSSAHHRDPVSLPTDGGVDPTTVEPSWGRLVGGVVRALVDIGVEPLPCDVAITSDLPSGRGLSSSAAFSVAVALSVSPPGTWDEAPGALAGVGQRAEHLATGVSCGIQDQMTSVSGGVALIDCRELSVEHLVLPEAAAVLVADSGVRRTLEGSPWAARRTASLADAAAIGLDVLRDATPSQVAGRPLAEHVVGEIGRVWAFAEALARGDLGAAGDLMVQSHVSSRDRWGSSVPELDQLVDELVGAGAWGARLTGGGFGGCVVGLVPIDRVEDVSARLPGAVRVHPSRGAHVS